MSRPLILVGAGEMARIALEYFRHDSDYEVIAFSAEREHIVDHQVEGLPVLAYEDLPSLHPPSDVALFVAIPATGLNRLRTRFYEDGKRKGYRFASYVSSRAFVWRNARIGENTFIFENNVVQPFVTIGDNCILWSGNHIGHRTVVHDNVFSASHAVVSGFCDIGQNSFIGGNATFNDGEKGAPERVIGPGAHVGADTGAG